MSENYYFNEALGNFTHDVASGGAIRHLTDLSYAPSEITGMLDYPTPLKRVADTMWQYMLESGIVRLTEPDGQSTVRYSFIREMTSTGRTSFRRVENEMAASDKEYVRANLQTYASQKSLLEQLSEADRSYLIDLPWPDADIWHEKNERICRIIGSMNKK